MSEEQEKYYDRILWESRLAQGLIEPDAPITPDPSFELNNKISMLLDIIQTQKEQMSSLQSEIRSLQSIRPDSSLANLESLQESLSKALDSILQKDDTISSLSKDIRVLREELKQMREELQDSIKRHEVSESSYNLSQEESRKKDKEIKALSKRLNKALDKILDLQSQSKLDKKDLYGKSSQKGIKAKKSEPRDRNQEKDDFDGTPGSENGQDAGSSTSTETSSSTKADTSNNPKVKKKPIRPSKYKTMDAANVVVHECDLSLLPEGYEFIEYREVNEFDHISYIQKNVYQIARVKNPLGEIESFYIPKDKINPSYPRVNTVKRTKVTMNLLSEMILNKFQLHCPINRQMLSYDNMKAWFSQQTISNYYLNAFRQFSFLRMYILEKLLTPGSFLHCDETWIEVKVKFEGKLKLVKKYLWCIVNEALGLTYFFYDEGSRSRDVLKNLLGGFEGSIQSDCYNVYKYLDDTNLNIDHIVCMAHVRAKFKKAQDSDSRAYYFLEKIATLYGIEKDLKLQNKTDEEIVIIRKERSLPILEEIKRRAEELKHTQKSRLGTLMEKAINYMLNCWDTLIKYTNEGYYTIDNSAVERKIRPVALGRKNYMQFGSAQSARMSAFFYSLVESCKMRGQNFKDYLIKLFVAKREGRTDYENLLPGLL